MPTVRCARLGWAFALLLAVSSQAAAEPALCDRAAALAAEEAGLPLPILLAITRTETARRGAPWPWTVNMEGEGHWFETRAEAEAFAERRYAAGARSFDIGCFQINHRWHGQHFNSIPDMFEPLVNARYAARFLTELYGELGSWDAAVGAYHSRTPHHAERYLGAFHRHLAALDAVPPSLPPPAPSDPPRRNSFPLLQAGTPRMPGSLVPAGLSESRPLFGARP